VHDGGTDDRIFTSGNSTHQTTGKINWPKLEIDLK